jgi:hypothetical protein
MVVMPFVPFLFPSSTALGSAIKVPVEKDSIIVNSNIEEKTGQKIAKETIYKQANSNSEIKKLFVQQIEQIIWRYKLSPDTLNIAASRVVTEVQVFDLILKPDCDELNLQVLAALDKSILSAIYFRLFYTNSHETKMQCAMADKRANKRDTEQMVVRDYFFSSKIAVPFNHDVNLSIIHQGQKLPVTTNMASLHQSLLRSLLPKPALENETLVEQLERIANLKVLNNKLINVQVAICKEKQFNRQVELNTLCNQIKQQIAKLS